MPEIRSLAILLLLAAVTAGDEEAPSEQIPAATEERAVRLQAAVPGDERKLGYPAPRSFVLETTAPRFLFEIPKFNAKDPLFFRVAFGETKGVPFFGALDRSPDSGLLDLLYLDRNRDLDLTNDGGPVRGSVRSLWSGRGQLIDFTGLTLRVPYNVAGKETTEVYSCVLYHVVKPGEEPRTIQAERDGWRQVDVAVGGAEYRLILVDDNSDGLFTVSDSWTLVPGSELEQVPVIVEDMMRSLRFLCWTADQKLTVEITSVDPAGRNAKLQIKPATESEQDYFARIARKAQSPEERKLRIDPLRPKASGKEKVDWLTGKNAQYAIDIGARATVNRRILLDFTAANCVWCARMNHHTFRDREVVELCKQFVCAKLLFKPGAEDTRKYNVEGTPTYVILDTDGSEISRQSGFSRPTDFAAWLRSALR